MDGSSGFFFNLGRFMLRNQEIYITINKDAHSYILFFLTVYMSTPSHLPDYLFIQKIETFQDIEWALKIRNTYDHVNQGPSMRGTSLNTP